jgi:hypothetical protein
MGLGAFRGKTATLQPNSAAHAVVNGCGGIELRGVRRRYTGTPTAVHREIVSGNSLNIRSRCCSIASEPVGSRQFQR